MTTQTITLTAERPLSRDSTIAERSYIFFCGSDNDADSGYKPARWAVRVVPDVFSSPLRDCISCSEAFNLCVVQIRMMGLETS